MSRSTELPPGEVHLWHAWLRVSAESAKKMLAMLSPDELAAADNFTVNAGRDQYVVSRAMLRIVLAQYAGAAPHELRFGVEAMGKPILIDPHRSIRFNLSHSGGLVVYGIARERSVGVDLEKVRPLPRAIAVARRYFSGEEALAVESEPAESRIRKFLTFWVRRESGAKARGASVWRALERYGRTDTRYAKWRVERDDPAWATISLDYLDEFVVSIVAKGSDWRLIQKGELEIE